MRLEEHPFFEGLDPAHVTEICSKIVVTEIPAETVIFAQNSDSDSLFLLLEGEVAFRKNVTGSSYRAVSFGHPGEFFGEIGLFTGEKRSTQAWASLTSKIAEIPRDQVLNFIRHHPVCVERILQSIVRHLKSTTNHYMTDMMRQEKLAMVGNMANTIVHDFKNPFTMINLASEMIARMNPDEETGKLCKMVDEQITRMNSMVEELHMFSRGRQIVRFGPVNLQALLQKFQELNQPFFDLKRLTFTIDVMDIEFDADESKLLRILQNLVTNSIEALKTGTGEIHILGEREGEYVRLIIRDSSGGIPEKVQRQLFEPFVTFGKQQGTGLGMAIVKSIVDAHNGSINFETEDHVGTTFYIRLPLKQSEQSRDGGNSPRIQSNYQ